ncbi:hypothetical protein JCM16358_18800 [Halanaerocella petrolearia]
MYDIPKYKVLAAYNQTNDACLDCDNHYKQRDNCLLHKAKSNLLDYSKHQDRLDEKFVKETFDQEDNKGYNRDQLEEIYEKVHDCCQHCGVYHTEKCFLNNTREALQILLYSEVIPWDGFEFKDK